MSNQHSKCDDCYKTHLPEAHDRTILPSEAFGEVYVPEFNQASKGEQRTLDDILSQAFTDGASDTMWIADRHIEIFATAKKELEAIIRTEKLKLLAEVRERVVDKPTGTHNADSLLERDVLIYNQATAYLRTELTKLEAEL